LPGAWKNSGPKVNCQATYTCKSVGPSSERTPPERGLSQSAARGQPITFGKIYAVRSGAAAASWDNSRSAKNISRPSSPRPSSESGTPHPASGHVGLVYPHSLGPHGLSASPNSFRRFPNGSSLPIRCGEGIYFVVRFPRVAAARQPWANFCSAFSAFELATIRAMDSLAPARSALRPSVPQNSFHRLPGGSSRVRTFASLSLCVQTPLRKPPAPWNFTGLKLMGCSPHSFLCVQLLQFPEQINL
jgi:hypothetical protein